MYVLQVAQTLFLHGTLIWMDEDENHRNVESLRCRVNCVAYVVTLGEILVRYILRGSSVDAVTEERAQETL